MLVDQLVTKGSADERLPCQRGVRRALEILDAQRLAGWTLAHDGAQRLGSCTEAGVDALHAAEAVVLQPHVVLVLGPELDGALARDDVGERVEPFAWDVDALRSVTSASVSGVLRLTWIVSL